MIRSWLVVGLMLLGGAPCWAQSSAQQEDFAYGAPISVQTKGAFYEMLLPAAVYDGLVDPDCGDIRVFNQQGRPAAHMLVRQRPGHTPALSIQRPIPFFPIDISDGDHGAGAAGLKLDITPDRTKLSVEAGRPRSTIVGYLLDLSGWKQRPGQLTLEWMPPARRFLAAVSVSGSDDLQRWQEVVPAAVLADLDYAGQRLQRHTILLSGRFFRYLRLVFEPDTGPVVELTRVIGSRRAADSHSVQRQWATVTGTPVDGGRSIWRFDLPGHRPVDRVAVRLSSVNAAAGGVLRSRSGSDDGWRRRGRGLFYHLETGRAVLENPALQMPATTDRHWQLTLESGADDIGDEPPRLAVGWVPQRLVFIARQPGPYVLAFGSARVSGTKPPLDKLLDVVEGPAPRGLVHAAVLGKPYPLGGRDRLKPGFWPLSGVQTVLWAVMIAGVLLMALLAWRLYRQMRNTQDS